MVNYGDYHEDIMKELRSYVHMYVYIYTYNGDPLGSSRYMFPGQVTWDEWGRITQHVLWPRQEYGLKTRGPGDVTRFMDGTGDDCGWADFSMKFIVHFIGNRADPPTCFAGDRSATDRLLPHRR